MIVTILGGHGQIALLLARRLADADHAVRATVRKGEHEADVRAAGANPVLYDMEADEDAALLAAVRGADAVVFAAGAGPGSGDARKRTVDYGGAVKLIDACRAMGVDRYLMVSAMGLDRAGSEGEMGPYLQAKLEADEALQASGLAYTIVRPGRLTDDPATGTVEAATTLGRSGEVPRDDVAAVLAEALEQPATSGLTFELLGGETPVADALRQLAAAPA